MRKTNRIISIAGYKQKSARCLRLNVAIN